MAGYKEQPAPPQRRADGQDGMDIEFETSSGDKVYVAVRPALVALNSLGWPAGGDLSAAEADDDLRLYDDEDSDWEDNVPRLVEEWPGWGRYRGPNGDDEGEDSEEEEGEEQEQEQEEEEEEEQQQQQGRLHQILQSLTLQQMQQLWAGLQRLLQR